MNDKVLNDEFKIVELNDEKEKFFSFVEKNFASFFIVNVCVMHSVTK